METINNAAAAVKNAVWGEGQNPDGTTNTSNTTTSSNTASSGNKGGLVETHKSMIDDSITESKPYSGRTESDPMAEGSYNPDKKEDYKPEGPTSTGGQPQGANLTGQQGQNDQSMSNSNEPNTGFGGAGAQPSVAADPSSGQQDTTKHQGADRPNEEPDSEGPGSSATPSSGGAAGGSTGPGGMKLPDSDKSEETGTGEKWEKSTGMQADGGDFDATRPGAAREADRLMEEKGIKHGDANPDGASGATDKKEKKWYGVDHSGFGGHGSHSNKKTSVSGASGTDASGKEHNDTSGKEHINTSGTEPIDSATGSDDVTGKKSITEKVKDKLHH